MKLWKKLTITAGVLIAAVPIALFALFVYSGHRMCGNQVFDEVISPDKNSKAVLFQRDCGMTTGFSTQISIIDADEKLKNRKGNIFIIDGHPDKVAPLIHWESNSALRISRTLRGTENKAVREFGFLNKITISYGAGNS